MADDYHDRPEISRSMLATFIKSPRLYEATYVTKALPPEDETDAMRIGTLTHQQLLEPDIESRFEVIDPQYLSKSGARSGNAWKEYESDAESRGIMLVKQVDYDTTMRAVEAVRKELGVMLSQPAAKREHELYWTDDESGLDLRAKLDLLVPTKLGLYVIDVKTTAQLNRFNREISDRLWLQFAHYRTAVQRTTGEEPTFFFCAVEKSGTFRVRNVTLSSQAAALAQAEYERQLLQLADRYQANDWSEDGEGQINEIDLPYFTGVIQ